MPGTRSIRVHNLPHLQAHPCSVSGCDRIFRNRAGLTKHLRTMHPQPVPQAAPSNLQSSGAAQNPRFGPYPHISPVSSSHHGHVRTPPSSPGASSLYQSTSLNPYHSPFAINRDDFHVPSSDAGPPHDSCNERVASESS